MSTSSSSLAGLLTDSFFSVPAKALIRLMSPGGRSGLSILIFHRVLAEKDPLFPAEVDQLDFDHQVGMLKSVFNVIPLIDAVRHIHAGTLPPRAACITFDDGYADNAEVALPVLQRHGVTATFFVATGFLDGGRMWNDSVIEAIRRAPDDIVDATELGLGRHPIGSIAERQQAIAALIGQLKYLGLEDRLAKVRQLVDLIGVALPDDLMMTSDQVRKLRRAGMDIGGHTVNHPILATLTEDASRKEIAEGKRVLEKILAEPIRLFAYPNGKPGADYCAEHVALVKELGFEGAVSTSWGTSKNNQALHQLPRFTPWDRHPLRFVLRMARNLAMTSKQT
jgi:peptidoglycan/xylan/chitin deacetylase (PgdA/CDA1 family)